MTRPEVLGSAVVILGVALVAMYYTGAGRRAAEVLGGRLKGSKLMPTLPSAPVPPGGHGMPPAAPPPGAGGPPATSPAAEFTANHPQVTFADVGGLQRAIDELREITEYLSDPERFRLLGAELPRGILLYGQPGCGKTLLARALAGETGVPFFFVSAASFVEQYVGVGAARVRQLFEEAKAKAPSIIFIDELDAVGRARSSEMGGGREFDHTLNQLLVELDGFLGSTGVLILAATNRPELIDPALLRPGRFDRRIHIDRPDRDGREQILRLHAGTRQFSNRIDWTDVATNTAGLTAAELANVINEASLLAARRHHPKVSAEDVEEAMARVLAGTRSSKLMSEEEKQLVAVHEAGHALLSTLLRGVHPPARISIVSRSGAFGRSAWSSEDDREVLTKRELQAQMMVLLGGRAAEINTFGEPSTRAEDDLEHAAALACRMVERSAMTGRFDLAGRGASQHGEGGRSGGESLGGKEVREMLRKAEQAARTILRDNAERLRLIADTLAEHETLTAIELLELTGQRPARATVSRLA